MQLVTMTHTKQAATQDITV